MSSEVTLLLTDVVDSTASMHRMGDEAAAVLWSRHDECARDLLAHWHGREIDKSDGLLALFDSTANALAYADAYHIALAAFDPPLRARAGIHRGAVQLRDNPVHHVSRGAKPVEVHGEAKPLAARIMSLARAGQTLVSAAARARLPDDHPATLISHGHWRFKGIDDAVELYEATLPGHGDSSGRGPPIESAKGWQVVRQGEHWVPVHPPPHSLPAERDRFVGRLDVLQELARRLARGARLVSLVGTGGVGKTRVAVHEGWNRLGDFQGGVWFTDLSSARSADGIAHAMAQGLQLTLAGSDVIGRIGDAIAGRGECLVIADNFEQAAAFAEATVGRWLDRAPKASFIVTTRERLGIVGEDALPLKPLSVSEAIALLRGRAASAGADSLMAKDEAVLPQLVQLLDCLPLAIELAAPRLRVLQPAQLLARMNERFSLLVTPHGRHSRQATLKATLDWSWDLLSASERDALAQLSVFDGGFDLSAAQAVIQLSQGSRTTWIVDLVQSLVDKSLVRKVGEQRFDLLRSVHDYASQRLDESAACAGGTTAREGAQARHWRHFAILDERQAMAGRGIEAENLVSACERATIAADGEAAARCLCAAWSALKLTGPFNLPIRLADALVDVLPARSPWLHHANWVAGCALQQLGDVEHARQRLDVALGTADAALACRALCSRGELHSTMGEFEAAHAKLEQALALARALEDDTMQCRSLNALGALHADQSQIPAARLAYEEALKVARRHGDTRWEGGVLGNLGGLNHNVGEFEAARTCYEQALRLSSDAGDRRWEGNIRSNLGLLHYEQNRPADARAALESALAIARHLGHARLESTVACNLGLLEEACGNLDDARMHFAEAVSAAKRQADRRAEASFQCYLGRLSARLGMHDEAARCLDRSATLLAEARDDLVVGLHRCASAELAHRRGDEAAARSYCAEARRLFERSGAGPESELGRELRNVERRLESSTASRG